MPFSLASMPVVHLRTRFLLLSEAWRQFNTRGRCKSNRHNATIVPVRCTDERRWRRQWRWRRGQQPDGEGDKLHVGDGGFLSFLISSNILIRSWVMWGNIWNYILKNYNTRYILIWSCGIWHYIVLTEEGPGHGSCRIQRVDRYGVPRKATTTRTELDATYTLTIVCQHDCMFDLPRKSRVKQ